MYITLMSDAYSYPVIPCHPSKKKWSLIFVNVSEITSSDRGNMKRSSHDDQNVMDQSYRRRGGTRKDRLNKCNLKKYNIHSILRAEGILDHWREKHCRPDFLHVRRALCSDSVSLRNGMTYILSSSRSSRNVLSRHDRPKTSYVAFHCPANSSLRFL